MKKADRPEIQLDNLDELFDFEHGEIVRRQLLQSGTRIRKSLAELFSGYALNANDILNETIQVEKFDGVVTMRDISFYSTCAHHFAPFFGKADVAYQPRNIITGIGKIVRLVHDVHARRFQIQEVMADDIATDIMNVLNAEGVYVRLRAQHLCICSRGPNNDTAWTDVIVRRGSLEDYQMID